MNSPIDILEEVLERGASLGAQYVEVRYVKKNTDMTILKNGVPELGGLQRSIGIGIRVLKNGGMGFSSFNEFKKASIERAINFAVKMAEKTGEKRKRKIVFSEEKVEEAKYESLGEKGKRPADVSSEEKLQKLFTIDKILKETKINAVIPFRFFQMLDETEEKMILTSEGAKIQSEIDRIHLFGLITAVNPTTGRMEQMFIQKGKSGGYEAFDYWNIEEYVEKQAQILGRIVTEAKEAPKGTIDYIIGPNVIGIMCHENQGHPSEGDRILGREGAQAGESYLDKDSIGKQIGSENVTVIDDPTIPGSYGFYLYDDEGIKARPRYLQKEGKFYEMLHNRESAGFLGVRSTGAARATNYDREPIPRMANTYLAPGDFTKEELIEDVKLGVLMMNFTEWNIDDRRYQSKYVGLEAYLIENGEVKHLVARPVIEITTPKLWSSIDAVAKKELLEFDAATCGKGEPMQGIPVYHGGTFARIRNVVVR